MHEDDREASLRGVWESPRLTTRAQSWLRHANQNELIPKIPNYFPEVWGLVMSCVPAYLEMAGM